MWDFEEIKQKLSKGYTQASKKGGKYYKDAKEKIESNETMKEAAQKTEKFFNETKKKVKENDTFKQAGNSIFEKDSKFQEDVNKFVENTSKKMNIDTEDLKKKSRKIMKDTSQGAQNFSHSVMQNQKDLQSYVNKFVNKYRSQGKESDLKGKKSKGNGSSKNKDNKDFRDKFSSEFKKNWNYNWGMNTNKSQVRTEKYLNEQEQKSKSETFYDKSSQYLNDKVNKTKDATSQKISETYSSAKESTQQKILSYKQRIFADPVQRFKTRMGNNFRGGIRKGINYGIYFAVIYSLTVFAGKQVFYYVKDYELSKVEQAKQNKLSGGDSNFHEMTISNLEKRKEEIQKMQEDLNEELRVKRRRYQLEKKFSDEL